MTQKSNNHLVSSSGSDDAFDRREPNEAKHPFPKSNDDEDVRSQPADPERYRRLVDDLSKYICLPPGKQSEHRIAAWEKREQDAALEGREPDLVDTFDAIARHAERRVRQSKMLDEVKDSLTERIFALEEEVYRRHHHCWYRPTAQALEDFRRRLQALMSRSFRRYKVI